MKADYQGFDTWKLLLTGEQLTDILTALQVASIKAETDIVRFNSARVYQIIRKAASGRLEGE